MDHDPSDALNQLIGKLAARSRHVCVLAGAGTSRPAGLPDVAGLQATVIAELGPTQPEVASVFTGRDLEAGINWLHRVRDLLGPSESVAGIDAPLAETLEVAINQIIVRELGAVPTTTTPYRHLATWAAGSPYLQPIEIFTTNYDLLFERGLEEATTPYFDGFVGAIEAMFRPELVEDPKLLPPDFVRVFKLHGSLNWRRATPGASVVRLGVPSDSVAAIYPSDDKYVDSRRAPYVVLQDRFRRALAEPETVTLITGYSFGDAHLNESIFDAARQHPRSEIVVFCYDDIPAALVPVAEEFPNVSVLASAEAILASHRAPWAPADIPDFVEGGRLVVGDFAKLAAWLARHRMTAGVDG